MPLSRRPGRALSWFVAACLLFAQTAALAYACSRGEAAAREVIVATPCSEHYAAHARGDARGDGSFALGNVCEVHCQTASLPDGGAFDLPSVVMVARWEVHAGTVTSGTPAPPAPELEARSAAPPLLAMFSRLLI